MSTGARRLVLRWLLLGVVAFGVVAMHHMMADHPMNSPDQASAMSMMAGTGPVDHQPLPDPSSPHGMLHACLAVLHVAGAAIMAVVIVLFGLFWPVGRMWTRRWPGGQKAGRSPPLAGRSLLDSVCVLRL